MSIETIMMAMNIILGLIVAYENLLFYKRTHMKNSWHWIKIAYALIGLYWSVLYTVKLFGPAVTDLTTWHLVFVRPAVTLTLAAIASSAIMRMKAHKE